jgi:hypothetical protein
MAVSWLLRGFPNSTKHAYRELPMVWAESEMLLGKTLIQIGADWNDELQTGDVKPLNKSKDDCYS